MYRSTRRWKPTAPAVTSANYETVSTAHQYVGIHFWAEWNGVDRSYDRAIQDLPSEIRAIVQFVSCDADDVQNESLWKQFSIVTLPSLVLLVGGIPIGTVVGARSSQDLATELISRMQLPIATTTEQKRVTKNYFGTGLARALESMCSYLRRTER